jgi:hypothetical protein
MRPNARFSDDVPVTAADVVSAWNMGTGDALRPEVRRLVRSVRSIDDRTLEISLENHGMDAPLALAHPALAVARRVSGSGWPLGTRPARITTDGNSPSTIAPAIITLVRFSADAALAGTPKDLSSVRFVVAPGRDLRDLLDERVDLLLTRDPAVLDYAATLPQFVSMPLPWQRTRVLLMPGRDRMSRALSVEERETFARDAVRGPARGALEPFWWQSMRQCEISYPQKPDALSTSGRIVYDGGDSTARDLAERLVGLVRASGPGPAAILDALLPARPRRTFQNAAGLTGEPLLLARRRGNDAGYIMSLDSRPLDSCAEMQAVVDDVGWMDPETIVPLVDTRLQAIVRRGRTGMILDWDGGLLLDGGDKR